MISGSFHTISQEWRYYSREKALIHTLHLAQLTTGTPGDTVEIASTASKLSQGLGKTSFSVPPITLPGPPSFNATVYNTFLQSVGSVCYGCVSDTKIITAQKNCGISIDSWSSTLLQVTFSPVYAGRYLIHMHGQSDQRTVSYQGPNNDGAFTQQCVTDGSNTVISETVQLFQQNMQATQSIVNVIHSSQTVIAQVNSNAVFKITNAGATSPAPAANMGCFIMLIDPIPLTP